MSALLWLVAVLPAVAGGGLLLAAISRQLRLERLAGPVTVGVALGGLVLSVVAAAGRPSASVPFLLELPARLAVDGLSAVMVVTVAAVTVLVASYAAAELGTDPEQARCRFFGLLLLFAAAMQLTVLAATLPVLLVGWELMGATSYALIGYWWPDRRRVESATMAFLATRAGDLGLYVAAGAAVAGLTSADRGALASLSAASPGWRDVIAAGVIIAAAGKSAQLPFSFWLARAMDGPSPVSALLHSATMVAAGAYLLLRTSPLLSATGWGAPTVAWLGAVTAIAMGITAVLQRDLKQLLAASTSAQVGFTVLAAGTAAVAGGAAQLVAHAATKALLFCVAGVWLSALGSKQLIALRGAARRWPVVGATFTVGALGLAGIPPLALWATKDAALAGAAATDVPLYLAGLVGAALSAVYSVRALTLVWQPAQAGTEAGYDAEQRGTRRVTAAMVAPLVVLAAAAAALVILGLPPVDSRLARALGQHSAAPPIGVSTPSQLALTGAMSVALAVVTAVGVRRGWGRGWQLRLRWAADWWGLERAAVRGVARPIMRLAGAAAWLDDRVVDAAVSALARGVLRGAGAANRLVENRVDAAVSAVAVAARGLGRWARRPQSGQLHQYYAQALVIMAVLVTVLLVVS